MTDEPVPLYKLLEDWLNKDVGWRILRIVPTTSGEAVIAYTDEEAERRWHTKQGEARYPGMKDVACIMSDRIVIYDIKFIDKPNTEEGVVLMASDPDFFFKLDEALKYTCFNKSEWFQSKDTWSGKRESWEV